MANMQDEQKEALLQLLKDTLARDGELRNEYQIGDKFRFIRDHLTLLLNNAEEHFAHHHEEEGNEEGLAEDETIVYVHLFNAQGMLLDTWKKMLLPKVFYEYSVNRPVYHEKPHVEALIRAKTNKMQHGYLAVVVKQEAVLHSDSLKDSLDNPLVKVKEGSLDIKRLLFFMHNEHEYLVGEDGVLIEKK